jgi:hypothetical protein
MSGVAVLPRRQRPVAVNLAVVVVPNLVAGMLCWIPVIFVEQLVVHSWLGRPSYEFQDDDEAVAWMALVFLVVVFGSLNGLLQLAVTGPAARWWAVALVTFLVPYAVITVIG